jgi:hypothetical protein
MNVKMDSRAGFQREGILSASVPNAKATPLPAGRAALTPGHKRQIFFGLEDLTESSSLARGYEEIDAEGTSVPRTQRPVGRFGPALNTICPAVGHAILHEICPMEGRGALCDHRRSGTRQPQRRLFGGSVAKRPLRFDAGPCRHYSPTLAGSLTMHMLEHQDGGIMAKIQVLPSPF